MKLNTLARCALILTIIPALLFIGALIFPETALFHINITSYPIFIILGLILAAISLVQSKRMHLENGKGLAIITSILGLLELVLIIIAVLLLYGSGK